MISQSNSIIRCPQCNNACVKIETPLTHEHSIECRVCGYQEIKTTTGTETFKGYGSLIVKDTIVLFHAPLSFEKEQEILKNISCHSEANFIKWTEEHGLTVLKGELPQEMESDYEEEYLKRLAEENLYLKNIQHESSCDLNDCILFNDLPLSGQI